MFRRPKRQNSLVLLPNMIWSHISIKGEQVSLELLDPVVLAHKIQLAETVSHVVARIYLPLLLYRDHLFAWF